MFRILHVGLGPLGQMIVADLYERRLGEVIGAVDVANEYAGRPLSSVVPKARANGAVLQSLDDFDKWKSVDCAIVTTSSSLESCAPTFRGLLRRGVAVISTCEELCYPYLRHERLAKELDTVAREHRGRLLGTGVNPGFLMDAFPVFATAISRTVRSVEVHRYQDATQRRIPFQRKIGVGLDERQFATQVESGTLRHVGLGESLHFIAGMFGFHIERWGEDIQPVRAEQDMQSGLGLVKKGAICGVRQEARGFRENECLIHLKFEAALGLSDPHDRVLIQGEPPIDLVWKGGVQGDIATSAIVLNSIAPLRAAAPGLHTMSTIPMVGWSPPRG